MALVRSAATILEAVRAVGDEVAPITPADSMVIRWEEPPPASSRGNPNPADATPASKYAPLAAELRTRPGVWALVFVGEKGRASTFANMIRFGAVSAFAVRGDYEAVTRSTAGRTRVYARYLGDLG